MSLELKSRVSTTVNVDFMVKISGDRKLSTNTGGGPLELGTWSTTGEDTREMKILRDNTATIKRMDCLTQLQSSIVTGHKRMNDDSLTDYQQPKNFPDDNPLNRKGVIYGHVGADINQVAGTIKVSEPGWIAICYCDQECNQANNWLVVGRRLIGF